MGIFQCCKMMLQTARCYTDATCRDRYSFDDLMSNISHIVKGCYTCYTDATLVIYGRVA